MRTMAVEPESLRGTSPSGAGGARRCAAGSRPRHCGPRCLGRAEGSEKRGLRREGRRSAFRYSARKRARSASAERLRLLSSRAGNGTVGSSGTALQAGLGTTWPCSARRGGCAHPWCGAEASLRWARLGGWRAAKAEAAVCDNALLPHWYTGRVSNTWDSEPKCVPQAR